MDIKILVNSQLYSLDLTEILD